MNASYTLRGESAQCGWISTLVLFHSRCDVKVSAIVSIAGRVFSEFCGDFDRLSRTAHRLREPASCTQYLNWRCGIGMNAAREKVRVAKALGQLPLISERFSQDRLNYSNVRAMTRVATQENEDYPLMIAAHGPVGHVEKLARW